MDESLETMFATWMREAELRGAEHRDALDDAWRRFENAGLVSRVVVHRVTCKRCGPVVTCVRVGGHTLAHHKAVKVGRGKNRAGTHPTARREYTLDGERWWPSWTESLDDAERWPGRVIRAECRHVDVNLDLASLKVKCDDAEPGKPGRPTLL